MQNNNISDIKQKRQQLKDLSAPFKSLLKDGAIESINQALIEEYTTEEHQVFKSYRGWLAAGYQVKKGAKAFLVWGVPQKLKRKSEAPPTQDTGEEKESEFFPLAYVFSNAQVEERRSKNVN